MDAARVGVENAVEPDPNFSARKLARLFPFASKEKPEWFGDLLERTGQPG
ncbi:hypothetical protein [Ruegeria marina]|nr:hypothetical protein [Ruegeria marina]